MKPAWESGAGFSALAAAGVLALNYPLIALFDHDTLVFGIPLPFLHVFLVWALLIAGLAVLVEHRSRRSTTRGKLRDSREHGVADPLNGVTAPVSGQPVNAED